MLLREKVKLLKKFKSWKKKISLVFKIYFIKFDILYNGIILLYVFIWGKIYIKCIVYIVGFDI